MKIDRLIGILSILLQQEKVTALELAEKFEVSRRTINRDVEALCKAGIPIVTSQGAHGGISIMDGYRMDRTLFTSAEMKAILAGLRSLDSVSGTNQYRRLMEKLSAGSSALIAGDSCFLIDLSSWYKDSIAPKIELLRAAIEENQRVQFIYHSPKGERKRCIEPYLLVFQWSSWYVWGWCVCKEDFRLFKLSRLSELCLEGKSFERRQVPLPDFSTEHVFPAGIQIKALFSADCKWRLIEEYGVGCYSEQKDGKLLFSCGVMDENYLLGWILSFGNQVRLLEPEYLRVKLAGIGKDIWKSYGDSYKKDDNDGC